MYFSMPYYFLGDGQKGARGRDLYVKVPLGTVVTERLADFWEDGGDAHIEEDTEDLDDTQEEAHVGDSGHVSDGSSVSSEGSELYEDEELEGGTGGTPIMHRGAAPPLPMVRLSALIEPAKVLEAARSKEKTSSKSEVALGRAGKESLPLIDYSVCSELAELSSLSPDEQRHFVRQKHRMERHASTKKQREQHGWILPSPLGAAPDGFIDDTAPPQRVSVDMDVPGIPLRVAVGGAPGLGNRSYAGTGSSRAKSLVSASYKKLDLS
jgi:GTPase involved in cell partitioning and DNA repair